MPDFGPTVQPARTAVWHARNSIRQGTSLLQIYTYLADSSVVIKLKKLCAHFQFGPACSLYNNTTSCLSAVPRTGDVIQGMLLFMLYSPLTVCIRASCLTTLTTESEWHIYQQWGSNPQPVDWRSAGHASVLLELVLNLQNSDLNT